MKQPTREIISSGNTVWKRVDHTETGGFTLDTTNLPTGSYIRAGAMMTFDASTRMATVIPSAVLAESAANNATVYHVAKGSIFTVGKNMAATVGGAAYPISAIDTTGSSSYDSVTLSTTLGVALTAGAALFLSNAAGPTAGAYTGTVKGLLHDDTLIEKGTAVDVVTHGVVYARRTPGVPTSVRTLLPLIIFSESF